MIFQRSLPLYTFFLFSCTNTGTAFVSPTNTSHKARFIPGRLLSHPYEHYLNSNAYDLTGNTPYVNDQAQGQILSVDPNRVSSSGVRFGDVQDGLNKLYPDEDLSSRNALSRTDGYWSYISKGEEPDQGLTYGEFDLLFFADLIEKGLQMHIAESGCSDISQKVFTDIGSGTGRLVFGAAALHPNLKLARGIEILPGIHEKAVSTLEACTNEMDGVASLPFSDFLNAKLAPIAFRCGSFDDRYEYYGDSDIIFVFSTCFSTEMMSNLSDSIGAQCKEGTIIITTEYKLNTHGSVDPVVGDGTMPFGDYKIDLIDSVDGECELVGGRSTAHIHRVAKSAAGNYYCQRTRPEGGQSTEVQEEAMDALKYLKPRNQMSFEEFVKSQ